MRLIKLTAIFLLSLNIMPTHANITTGNEGGGGDASEVRVNEIRADILKWINDGGYKGLTLLPTLTYDEYQNKMADILQPKKVIIGFVEKDSQSNDELQVNVNGVPKTCRGFFSTIDTRPHIICNISRFQNTSESEQYTLIHHEYAGLANIEQNDGAASSYELSSQLTDFLSKQIVLKLAVKKSSAEVESEFKCILPPPRGEQVSFPGIYRGGYGQDGSAIAKQTAMTICVASRSLDCKIEEATLACKAKPFERQICTVMAVGFKKNNFCSVLYECQNRALNDMNVSTKVLEKLNFLQNTYKCL